MSESKKIIIPEEQLDALAQSFLPTIRDFFTSERGKKLWEDHLKEIEQGNENYD